MAVLRMRTTGERHPPLLRLVRPGPQRANERRGAVVDLPAGRPGWRAWVAIVPLAVLIGLATAILGGCGSTPAPAAKRAQTDEERCQARGGYWTVIKGQEHCLARPLKEGP